MRRRVEIEVGDGFDYTLVIVRGNGMVRQVISRDVLGNVSDYDLGAILRADFERADTHPDEWLS